MGWQWHQLDRMQIICFSLQTDNLASTLAVKFLQSRCSSSKHWRQLWLIYSAATWFLVTCGAHVAESFLHQASNLRQVMLGILWHVRMGRLRQCHIWWMIVQLSWTLHAGSSLPLICLCHMHYTTVYYTNKSEVTIWDGMKMAQITLLRKMLASSPSSICAICCQRGHARCKTLLQQNPTVVNWGCWLRQIVLYNGHKMVVVVLVCSGPAGIFRHMQISTCSISIPSSWCHLICTIQMYLFHC